LKNIRIVFKIHVFYVGPKFADCFFFYVGTLHFVWYNLVGALPMVYFFWVQSSASSKVLLLQKRAIRIMTGCGPRDSCRKLFAELGILTLPSQYIFSLLLFTVKNRKLFHVNQDLHSLGTRQQQNFHQPLVNLKKYQLGPYYMGLKLYNTLPTFLETESHSCVSFRLSLKKILLEFPIYSIDEFYDICKLEKHKLQE